eukprot:scaffold27613_cov45-Attheya_sp.AAC.1
MAEPMALRLHDNQSFLNQLGYAVHQTAVQTMAHLKPKCAFLERYGVKACQMSFMDCSLYIVGPTHPSKFLRALVTVVSISISK